MLCSRSHKRTFFDGLRSRIDESSDTDICLSVYSMHSMFIAASYWQIINKSQDQVLSVMDLYWPRYITPVTMRYDAIMIPCLIEAIAHAHGHCLRAINSEGHACQRIR